MAMVWAALSRTSKPHLFLKEFYDKLIRDLCKNGTFTPEQTERWLEIICQFPVPEEESNGPHEGWETDEVSRPTDQSKSDEAKSEPEPEAQEEEEDEEQRAERLQQEFVAFQARKKKRKQSGGSGESRKCVKPSSQDE